MSSAQSARATLTRVGAHLIEHVDAGSGPALLALHGGMGGNIRVPILAIHGTDDDIVPYTHAERLAAHCSTAKLLGIENGEHIVLFTHVSSIRSAVQAAFEPVRRSIG